MQISEKHSSDPFRRLDLLPKCSLRYDIPHLLILECRSINIYLLHCHTLHESLASWPSHFHLCLRFHADDNSAGWSLLPPTSSSGLFLPPIHLVWRCQCTPEKNIDAFFSFPGRFLCDWKVESLKKQVMNSVIERR